MAAQDLVGVNPDRRESDLDVIPEDVLALWRGNAGNAAQQASSGSGAAGPEKALQPVVVRYAAIAAGGRCRIPAWRANI